MTAWQLPTGKTVFIKDIINLSDDDIDKLIADDSGTVINDPFYDMGESAQVMIDDDFYLTTEVEIITSDDLDLDISDD